MQKLLYASKKAPPDEDLMEEGYETAHEAEKEFGNTMSTEQTRGTKLRGYFNKLFGLDTLYKHQNPDAAVEFKNWDSLITHSDGFNESLDRGARILGQAVLDGKIKPK